MHYYSYSILDSIYILETFSLRICICMYACVCVYMYMYMYICMYVCMSIYDDHPFIVLTETKFSLYIGGRHRGERNARNAREALLSQEPGARPETRRDGGGGSVQGCARARSGDRP